MLQIKRFKGRFANNLLHYATLRIKADGNYGCRDWLGREFFAIKDPPPISGARTVDDFEKHSSFYKPHKLFLRSLFRFQKDHIGDITEKLTQFRAEGHTLIGIHLRRGDYGTFRRKSARWCFVAPTQWYLDWLWENVQRFPKPIVFIASDEMSKVLDDFKDYQKLWLIHDERGDVIRDFYTLTQCDVLLISNSTFGFTASMLNERATEFYRPRLLLEKLIAYDPWNSPVVLKDDRHS